MSLFIYHGFLTGVLRGIKGYRAISDRKAGNGRADIFLKPRNVIKPAVVIEVKVANIARPQDLRKRKRSSISPN